MTSSKIYKVKIFFLFLFIMSLPFENWDPLGIAHFFTVTKFAGLLYFVFSILDVRRNFGLRYSKHTILILLLLWLLLLFQGAVNYWHGTTHSIYNFTYLQNIVFFLLISNDIVNKPSLVKRIFLSLILGVFVMATFASAGLGLSTELDSELGTFRLTFFGSNPNTTGNLAAVALLFVISIVMYKSDFYGRKSYLLLLTIPSMIAVISLSGSRGALLVSFLGATILLLLQKTKITRKLFWLFVGSFLIIVSAVEVMQTEVMQRRVNLATSEGSLGGREIIWKYALEIFYQNPFFGVGNTGYQYHMINTYGSSIDTHNLFLYFMVCGGVLALFLYLAFLYELFKRAKNYYVFKNSALLYAILIVYLFFVFKSGGAINNKLFWMLAGIIFGLGMNPERTAVEIKLNRYYKP